MIISASRKTDIPAYYAEWFIKRIKAGFVCSRNPMNVHQISRIPLDPEVDDCIVFWTKNPIPMNERYTAEYHIKAFSSIAEALSGCTEKCVISFVDLYQKIQKNMKQLNVEEASADAMIALAARLREIGAANHMVLATCAEKIDLSSVGIEHNACIDRGVIERICGGTIKAKKDPAQRAECQCVESRDIGTYNTCANGCRYCYANFSPEKVRESMAKYDPESPILCDAIDTAAGDVVSETKAKSLLDRQLTMF